MKSAIVETTHLILMHEVDSSAADKYIQHIGPALDAVNGDVWFSDVAVMRWCGTYWAQQIEAANVCSVSGTTTSLISCLTLTEFVSVFRAIVVPFLQANPILPNTALPVHKLEAFIHG